MGLEFPSEFEWLKYVTGVEWPEGDEDAMRQVADAWRTAGSELDGVSPALESAVSTIMSQFEGVAASQLQDALNELATGDYSPAKVAEACRLCARMSDSSANDIEYTKIAFYTALAFLALQIALAIANSFWTMGSSLAEIPIAEAIARTAVAQGLKTLLDKVAANVVGKIALKLAEEAAIGAATMALQEAVSQGAGIGMGDRNGFNLGDIGKKLAEGGLGGAAGGVAGDLVGGGLGRTLGQDTGLKRFVNSRLTGIGSGTANAAAAGGLGAVVFHEKFDPMSLASGGLSGGLLAHGSKNEGAEGGSDARSTSSGSRSEGDTAGREGGVGNESGQSGDRQHGSGDHRGTETSGQSAAGQHDSAQRDAPQQSPGERTAGAEQPDENGQRGADKHSDGVQQSHSEGQDSAAGPVAQSAGVHAGGSGDVASRGDTSGGATSEGGSGSSAGGAGSPAGQAVPSATNGTPSATSTGGGGGGSAAGASGAGVRPASAEGVGSSTAVQSGTGQGARPALGGADGGGQSGPAVAARADSAAPAVGGGKDAGMAQTSTASAGPARPEPAAASRPGESASHGRPDSAARQGDPSHGRAEGPPSRPERPNHAGRDMPHPTGQDGEHRAARHSDDSDAAARSRSREESAAQPRRSEDAIEERREASGVADEEPTASAGQHETGSDDSQKVDGSAPSIKHEDERGDTVSAGNVDQPLRLDDPSTGPSVAHEQSIDAPSGSEPSAHAATESSASIDGGAGRADRSQPGTTSAMAREDSHTSVGEHHDDTQSPTGPADPAAVVLVDSAVPAVHGPNAATDSRSRPPAGDSAAAHNAKAGEHDPQAPGGDHDSDVSEIRYFDDDGTPIPTRFLKHPYAWLIDRLRIDAVRESPTRAHDALSAGEDPASPAVHEIVGDDYRPYGHLTEEEWNNKYWPGREVDMYGNPKLRWPDTNKYPDGFFSPIDRAAIVLTPGMTIDRFGPAFGQYVSPVGTAFEQRGLPQSSLAPGSYHRYEVVEPIPAWGGKVAPAMEQPGGGVQFWFNDAIVDLVRAGYLREVVP